MGTLSDYILEMQKRGYPLSAIRDNLLRHGYAEDTIDHAIYNLSPKSSNHVALAIIAFFLIILSSGAAFLFLRPAPAVPQELLDVSITELISTIEAGDFLSGKITITNKGSDKRYDAYLKYEVFSESGERLTFGSETIAIESEKTHDFSLRIPQDTVEGTYTFKASARYQTEQAIAQRQFAISKKAALPTCNDGTKNQDESDIDCGGICQACKSCPSECDDGDPLSIGRCDASTGFKCVYDKASICGDGTCAADESDIHCPDDCRRIEQKENPWDALERIKKLALDDPAKSREECNIMKGNFKDICLQNVGAASKDANTCDMIEEESKKDKCFIDVAVALDRSVICANVAKESRRDGCYAKFISRDDFSVCDKIVNGYIRQSCETLRQTKV